MASSIQIPNSVTTARALNGTLNPNPAQDWDAFMRLARKRFQLSAEADREIRAEGLEDLKMYSGDQWPADVRSNRQLTNRPCLTFNRLPEFGRQVINAQRQSRPSVQVNPVGDGADVDTAEILQGLIRHVEVNSDAEVAYDTAFEHAVIHGRGYFRIRADFLPGSFNQEIFIDRILDPFAVYYDPSCQQPDYADADYAFIVSEYATDIYRDAFPNSQVASLADFRSIGDSEREWYSQGCIRVAEYFYMVSEKKTLVMLTDGKVIDEADLTAFDRIMTRKNGQPVTREMVVRTPHWVKMNSREILEPTDKKAKTLPGDRIPIIPVLGEELIVDGKRKLIGIVRYSRDAQRMYNYGRTAVVEQLNLSSKSPWLIAEGQIEGYEEFWRQANTRNWPYLPYRPKTVGNVMAPPPIRNTFEPPIQGLTASILQAGDDLQHTTGMYNPSLGQREGEQSGRAIVALQRAGEQSQSHLLDNQKRGITACGRLLLKWMRAVYDVPQVKRIINPDQSHKMVQLNQEFPVNPDDPQSITKIYDITTGIYDVVVGVSSSYQTRRQEFVAAVLELVKAAPQLMQFVMDLLVRNMDWPGAQEIADRLKKMLPQSLQDDPSQEQIPDSVKAQVTQIMSQNAQLVQQLEQAMNIIHTKKLELDVKRLDIESKERQNAMTNQTNLVVADLKTRSDESLALMREEFLSIKHRLDLLHSGETVEQDAIDSQAERDHAAQQADLDRQHQAEMANQQQQNQAGPQPQGA
jgi:Phage P22-like portal protein